MKGGGGGRGKGKRRGKGKGERVGGGEVECFERELPTRPKQEIEL